METKTAARAMPGMDMMMSRIRMIVSETALRETAARRPRPSADQSHGSGAKAIISE